MCSIFEVLLVFCDDVAVDTEIPESTTALLNMPNSKIINVYLKLNSTADLDKIDTWTNVRSGVLRAEPGPLHQDAEFSITMYIYCGLL